MSKILINLFKKTSDNLLYQYARVLQELLQKTIVVTPCDCKSSGICSEDFYTQIPRLFKKSTNTSTVIRTSKSDDKRVRNIQIRERYESSVNINPIRIKYSRATSPGPKLFNMRSMVKV